ncbi:IS200/IS605 family transposase [Candidatus Micrarchaeota archaeon]|nr:IS200/IS605 family transposase [Candidatus Micrarchaeota archaeon]MBU2477262.1 IS200/IS605 family transposase [Candidatus Micrarchaeota archaeon]
MTTDLKLLRYAHTVGESNCHLQFTPKYRKKIFEDKDLRAECEREFKRIAEKLKVQLAGVGFGPDHVHLFVTGWKNYSISQLAQRFKGTSQQQMNNWKNYYNFIRPHQALNGKTPSQKAGIELELKENKWKELIEKV